MSGLSWVDICQNLSSLACTVCLVGAILVMDYTGTGGTFGRTTRHIFYTKDKIGTGASCDVFKGVEKVSGQTHALKIFKDALWSRSEEKTREVEALSKVSHRNIVGYYGKEEEYGTGRGVLVMEYCSGGSLHAFLQEPENIHGLDDKEFLTFLNDTCQGWKYLRQCGFVHRDIKPGNILRCVKIDGSVTYKLADFGASKSVGDNDGEFMSLAGTEEYLHPAMYEKAFIDPSGRFVFTESVDLWSFGVTIYHACTGELPFKPFGGVRKNRSIMFMMITRKPPGTIGGDQLTASEDIRWRRTLPETCRLSSFMQEKVVLVLAGLMEADPYQQWTFRTLEDSAKKLVSLRRFTVVNVEDATLHTVYTSQGASLSETQEAIASVTDVAASLQILLYDNQLLNDGEQNQFGMFEEDNTITLVSRSESDECLSMPTTGRPPSFGQRPSVDEDVKTAVKLCAFIYLLLVQVLNAVKIQREQKRAPRTLWSHLKDILYRMEKKFKVLSETCREKQSRYETMREMETTRKVITRESNTHVKSSANKAKKVLNRLHQQLWHVKNEITSLREQIHHASDCTVTSLSEDTSMNHRDIKGRFHEAKTILQRMKGRKLKVPLSDLEENMHKKDRNDLLQLGQDSVLQWEKYSLNRRRLVHLSFQEAKRSYLALHGRLQHVEKVLEDVTKGRSELSQALTETSAFSGRAWKNVVSGISILFEQPTASDKSSQLNTSDLKMDLDKNKERLKSLLEDLPEVEILSLDL